MRYRTFNRMVLATAERISRALGYAGPYPHLLED